MEENRQRGKQSATGMQESVGGGWACGWGSHGVGWRFQPIYGGWTYHTVFVCMCVDWVLGWTAASGVLFFQACMHVCMMLMSRSIGKAPFFHKKLTLKLSV